MKKKLVLLSRWSFVLAFGIFVFSYFLYHYLSPNGIFTGTYQTVACKPVVTLLFAILGVLFLFTAILSRLIAYIFFSDEKSMAVRTEQLIKDLEKLIRKPQQELCTYSDVFANDA